VWSKTGRRDERPSPAGNGMTVVGSHYVAPGSFPRPKRSKSIDGALIGYDGTRPVWSAGVIPLPCCTDPFCWRDLLRCGYPVLSQVVR
jgi:hypothetical protein